MDIERSGPITKFYHSIKVPRFYTVCVKVLKDLESQKGSLNRLSANCKHPNKRGVNGLVSKLIEHKTQLDEILTKLKLFEKEPRFDQYLAKVLITERLWGSGKLVGDAKPLQILRKYESKLIKIFNKLSSSFESKNQNNKDTMINPYVILAVFSLLMFTAPFIVFFLVDYILREFTTISGFQEIVIVVIATLLTVFLIIAVYVCIAFQYDDENLNGDDNDSQKRTDKKEK